MADVFFLSSLLGNEQETAVTAITLSPKTSFAVLSRYVESTPAEKATATEPRLFKYSLKTSSFAKILIIFLLKMIIGSAKNRTYNESSNGYIINLNDVFFNKAKPFIN